MSTLYPNQIDGTAQLPNVSGTFTLDGTIGGADHALVTTNINTAVIALENVLGTTAGTSVLSAFTAGQTALPIQSGTLGTTIAKGTINNLSIGTINNVVLGTPTFVVGSDAQGDIYYRSSGGTLTRLGAGTVGQFLQAQGAASNPKYAYAQTFIGGFTSFNPMVSNGTNFFNPFQPQNYSATETTYLVQIPVPAGAIVSLYINVTQNNLNSAVATTFKVRQNAASAGPSISVGSAATGFFSNITPITTAAGDLIDIQVITGGNSGSISFSYILGMSFS